MSVDETERTVENSRQAEFTAAQELQRIHAERQAGSDFYWDVGEQALSIVNRISGSNPHAPQGDRLAGLILDRSAEAQDYLSGTVAKPDQPAVRSAVRASLLGAVNACARAGEHAGQRVMVFDSGALRPDLRPALKEQLGVFLGAPDGGTSVDGVALEYRPLRDGSDSDRFTVELAFSTHAMDTHSNPAVQDARARYREVSARIARETVQAQKTLTSMHPVEVPQRPLQEAAQPRQRKPIMPVAPDSPHAFENPTAGMYHHAADRLRTLRNDGVTGEEDPNSQALDEYAALLRRRAGDAESHPGRYDLVQRTRNTDPAAMNRQTTEVRLEESKMYPGMHLLADQAKPAPGPGPAEQVERALLMAGIAIAPPSGGRPSGEIFQGDPADEDTERVIAELTDLFGADASNSRTPAAKERMQRALSQVMLRPKPETIVMPTRVRGFDLHIETTPGRKNRQPTVRVKLVPSPESGARHRRNF